MRVTRAKGADLPGGTLLIVLVAAVLLAGGAVPVSGQIVRGQVVDSVTGVPLPGATIVLLAAGQAEADRTVADDGGLFLLRSGGAAEYRVRVSLDGYRISTFPPFDLAADEVLAFMLLVPSLTPPPPPMSDEDIIARACPDGAPEGLPVIVGLVLDRATGRVVPNAEVRISVPPISLSLQGYLGTAMSSGSVSADADGVYAVCGVSLETRIAMHAVSDDRMSQFATLTFNDGGVRSDLTFREMPGRVWQQDFELRALDQWTASVTGVVSDTGGVGVASAELSIPETHFITHTDDEGRFRFDSIPAGTALFELRQAGFRSGEVQVSLQEDELVEVPPGFLILTPAPIELEGLNVVGEAPPGPRASSGFERRRATTSGSFLTREEFERMGNPREPSQIVLRLRGFRVLPNPDYPTTSSQRWVIVTRRGQGRSFRGCSPIVFLDQHYLGTTANIDIDAAFAAVEIAAIEGYTSSSPPPAFNRPGAVCGVIVFHTRQ